ncbi:SDR family oxidoreductase [Bordetella parapertussis]|uniref:Short chain dehydrogenase n=6 Tax=Bordetella TaxID=517 RepID=K0MB69_BORPB|nr:MULTISPECIES: SDR family oxidoreductase [Bordetella]KAK59005.1 oxidoreductase YgfF [Bordetella bronchiseptica 980-2]KDD63481.1 oxidoreductase YgfF [Bordetella bronchiseptica OSU553]SHP65546.1 short-chain dehydrogenase [Mycobacteroides abscessus subsp. abscessus]AMG90578.1 NAD(P)-dependent oxidoreductase [Bordetella bronchiseptica]AOB41042.1 NAD(P)-dependent oxidoreductase [Bordetella parapertussis]
MIDHLSPNKVMIVTGAARGIGAAVALLAARRGYAVCVNYRSRGDAAEQVVQAIRDEGGRALAVAADVADEAQVVRMFETVDRELGRVDALVNNAGILEAQMRVEEMDAARITRILATNVVGAFVCCREAVRRMAPRHGGRGGAIVNVSSVAARLGSPGEYVDYAASKGALDTLTIGLSREVAADEIRVNAVRPGTIYTDMHASGGEPGRVDRLKDGIPLRRGGTVQEVAGAVMWFFSDEAGYTTGSFIEVSGGK